MAGSSPPSLSLSVIFLSTNLTVRTFTLPAKMLESDGYLTALSWTSLSLLTFTWVSKNQDLVSFITCKMETMICQTVQSAQFPIIGELGQLGHFSPNGQEMVFVGSLQARSTQRTLILSGVGGQLIQLDWEKLQVSHVQGWDPATENIYFLASPAEDEEHLHLYSVQVTRSNIRSLPSFTAVSCLSCDSLELYNCSSSTFHCSSSLQFFIQDCWMPLGFPVSLLYSLPGNTLLSVLDTNRDTQMELERFAIPSESLHPYNVQLIQPDMTSNLLLVRLSFHRSSHSNTLNWFSYLVKEKNYLVAKIDMYSSQFPGMRSMQAEADVALHAVRELVRSLGKVSKFRVCLLGEGIGASLIGFMMSLDTDGLVHCGVMVNPVTDWRSIDMWTAEQMFGDVQLNFTAYNMAKLTTIALNVSLRAGKLLVVDDSAFLPQQLQQTLLFSTALVEMRTVFQQMVYPDRDIADWDNVAGDILDSPNIHLQLTVEQFIQEASGCK